MALGSDRMRPKEAVHSRVVVRDRANGFASTDSEDRVEMREAEDDIGV